MNYKTLIVVSAAALLLGCPEKKKDGGGGGGPTVNRCEFDVAGSALFSQVGSGASAKIAESQSDLFGGDFAQGQVGDAVLQNDKIRVVIQRPNRAIAPTPFGGYLIDADLQRQGGEGHDSFGRLGLYYAFGRSIDATAIEVINDGSNGGAAIVAVTGNDAENDYVSIPNVIGQYLPNTKLVVDPSVPLPIRATTYYVLSPGENRVRVLTNFCNDGAENVQMPIGELIEQGGTSDFFNPKGCANRPGTQSRDGSSSCLVDPASWYGYQAKDVAYGIRSYKPDAPTTPEDQNALLSIAGVVGTLVGGQDQTGLLTWTDASATKRPGAFAVKAGGSKAYLRDFVVARDLGDIYSSFIAYDNAGHARLNIAVTGADVAESRIEVMDGNNRVVAILLPDSAGKAKIDLPAGTYTVTAGVPGRLSSSQSVVVPSSGGVDTAVDIPVARKLTVTVKDPNNKPQPAKVTVFCASGNCPNANSWTRFEEADFTPSNVQTLALVPTSGTVEIPLPAGQYAVVVTRGPEYSAWPDTWRPADVTSAQQVDLTTTDQSVNATIAQVVDSTGWMSADLHVHAVNSPDSSVPNVTRVASYMSEGVDILCSTDHDFITDFAPELQALNGTDYMATMIGDEVTTFDFGHYNNYPLVRDPGSVNGGALDWANGTGTPTYRQKEMFDRMHELNPDSVVQLNHARGAGQALDAPEVDTATGATHADPTKFRMAVAPDATADDTKIFSWGFDAMEVQNGLTPKTALMNDWFTFLSAGHVKTATAVSDTHHTYNVAAGYSRTWVKMDADAPSAFTPSSFAQRLKAHKAIGSNGPFVRFTAQKLDSGGQPIGSAADVGDTLSVSASQNVELTVDVQAPEYMDFDQIEIYTHAPGREAVRGAENTNALVPVTSKTLNLAALPFEPVVVNSQTFRRIHVTEKFTVTPTADTWYVAIVRSSSAAKQMFPLAWDGTNCSGGVCTYSSARPYAYTNAILIDADGSGAYDNFPLKPSGPPPPAPLKLFHAPVVPTVDQFNAMLREIERE